MTHGRFIDRFAAGPHFPRQQGGRFTALGVLAVAVLVASCSGTETSSANVKITAGLEAHFRMSQATCKPAPGSQPGVGLWGGAKVNLQGLARLLPSYNYLASEFTICATQPRQPFLRPAFTPRWSRIC
jgi:hypothetical protein